MKRVVMSCLTQDCGGDVKSSRSMFFNGAGLTGALRHPETGRAGLPGFNAFLYRPGLIIKAG